MKYTYIFLVWVCCNVVGVLCVLNEIRPPRSKFRIFDLTVLQLEFEVGVDSNELSVGPPWKEIS